MTLAPHEVNVYRENKWVAISSYDLKPGDIINVDAGYQHKKLPHEMISDEEFLKNALPFGSGIATRMKNPNQKK